VSTPSVSRGRAAPQGSSTLPNQAIPTQSGPSAQLPASAGSQASLPARQLSQLEVDPAALTVVRSRHPWRWVAAIAMLILVAQFINGLITNPGWDWPAFAQYFTAPAVLHALWLTIQLTVYGTVLGFALGMALAAARLSKNPVLQTVSWTYVWAFRSIPLIVQLLFWFNIAYLYQNLSIGIPFGPAFFSFDVNATISGMAAAVIGLGLHQAAYSAEIIRAGILSVDQGQLEAAAALGIPKRRQFFKIVLPQAMRGILPNAANEVISLFKGTSIVSTMAIAELFYQVQVIYGRNGRVVPLLMVATVWYILLTTVLSIAQYYVERHYAKGAVRNLPLTPWQKVQRKITNVNAGRHEATFGGVR
jgi:polar amino acid transport system permease protein